MSAILLNIVIGLVTSLISGGSVWLWQRARNARALRRKAEFFGIQPGGTCLIVMNNKWDRPRATAHSDVQALVQLAVLARELGAEVSVRSCDEIREGNGDRTEFCIGGPLDSNPRTAGHLAAHVPGVTVLPRSESEPMTLVVGDQRFPCERTVREYALVARFTPPTARRPVIVISGQTSIANRAAVHLLLRDHRVLARTLASVERFALVARVTAPDVYGHEAVELVGDVTEAAFASPGA